MKFLVLASLLAIGFAHSYKQRLDEDPRTKAVIVEGSGVDLVDVIEGVWDEYNRRNKRDETEVATTTEATTSETNTVDSETTTIDSKDKNSEETPATKPAATGNETTTTACSVKKCSGNEDCNGGKCIGVLLDRCDCMACTQFWPCKNDYGCGGLRGACQKGLCQCWKAFEDAGYPILKRFELCNRKQCSKDECLGLSCNAGLCACPSKKN